ncbi:MAG: DGQHR domain-containing protein [Kineosporiaceae bacterium]|nr:DGQHR domain-containing protein [Kineosporiaceae bacterium]
MSTARVPDAFTSDSWVPPRGVRPETRKRLNPSLFRTVRPSMVPALEDEGWVVDRRLKSSVRMRVPKAHDAAFLDRTWAALARLYFPTISRGSSISIPLAGGASSDRNVSLIAADDEVVLVVDCVSMDTLRAYTFRDELAAIQETRSQVMASLRRSFPERKVKFVVASSNCIISRSTADKFIESDVVHMDEDVIDYYLDLAEHLGRAARYQLLGSLFAGMKIPGLEPRVAAIQCNMGGHKYYSFVIEPDRLLKLGYILHRNKANSSLMPTYQRLIKKTRLKQVSQFIEAGGFFPNSLIISVDPGRRPLRFDPVSKGEGSPRMGILHLPQTYRAAYIIDGQHRLYGYADSPRSETDLIPVVAFVDLPRSEQVRIFMEINENQQAVPKNLRNTLNADLLWSSTDLREQARALKLRVAQQLGESRGSPLFGRVIIGEDKRTLTRCVTIDAISRGLDRGTLLGSYTRTEVRDRGNLVRGSNDATYDLLSEFLTLCFGHIRGGLSTQWSLGAAEGGFVFINNGIESLLRMFSDIVDHLLNRGQIAHDSEDADELFHACLPYLDALVRHLSGVSGDEAAGYRSQYGSGGATKYWRRLQEAVRSQIPEFDPPGLEEYLAGQARQDDADSQERVRLIELFLKNDVRRRLENEFGSNWFQSGVPKGVKKSAGTLAAEKNADAASVDEQVEPWDCLYIVDYHAILTQDSGLWGRQFEKQYTRPGDEKKPGGWKARPSWLQRLNSLRNDLAHGRSIGPDDHEFLISLETWLVKGQADNDL